MNLCKEPRSTDDEAVMPDGNKGISGKLDLKKHERVRHKP